MTTVDKMSAKKIEAYTHAYNQYFPMVYGIVKSKVSNPDEAEDICQEVFLAFYDKFETIENHRKWLYGTIRYIVYDYYRTKQNKSETDINELSDDISLSFVNGFRDTRLIIEEALENEANYEHKLSRTIFEMVAIFNFSLAKTSRELKITYETARYHYNKTVQLLTNYLKEKGICNLEDLL